MWVQLIALGWCPTTSLFIFFVFAPLFLGDRIEAWLRKSYLASGFLPKTSTSSCCQAPILIDTVSRSLLRCLFANHLFIFFAEMMSALSSVKTLFCPPFTQAVDPPPHSFSLAQLFFAASATNMWDLIQHIRLQPDWLSAEAMGRGAALEDEELITTDNVTIKYSVLYRLLLLVQPSSKTCSCFLWFMFLWCYFDSLFFCSHFGKNVKKMQMYCGTCHLNYLWSHPSLHSSICPSIFSPFFPWGIMGGVSLS